MAHGGCAVDQGAHAQLGPFSKGKGATDAASLHDFGIRAHHDGALFRVQADVTQHRPGGQPHAGHGAVDTDTLGLPSFAFLLLQRAESPRELKPGQVLRQPQTTKLKEVGRVVQPKRVCRQFLHVHSFGAMQGDELALARQAVSIRQIQHGHGVAVGGHEP